MKTIKSKCAVCGDQMTLDLPDTGDNPEMLKTVTEIGVKLAKMTVHNECFDNKLEAEAVIEARDKRLLLEEGLQKEWQVICPPEFRKELDWANKHAKRANYDKVVNWRGPKGLFVVGYTRLCKTRFIYKMLACRFMDGASVVALTHAEFRERITYLSKCDVEKCHKFIDTCCKADILFIDDLGAVRITGASEEAFEMILNKRTQDNKPCLFTANTTSMTKTRDKQSAWFASEEREPAIMSRIGEFCTTIEFQ